MCRQRGILAGLAAGALGLCACAPPAPTAPDRGGPAEGPVDVCATESATRESSQPAPRELAHPATQELAPAPQDLTPPKVVRFVARPDGIPAATSTPVTLAWAVQDATEVEIVDDTGRRVVREVRDPVAGELLVRPDRTQEFVLTAHGLPGTRPAVAHVRVSAWLDVREGPLEARDLVLDPPVVRRLTVDPPAFTEGETIPVRVRWEAPGARTVTLVADPGGAVDLAAHDPEAGEAVVPVEGPTAFSLQVTNRWGDAHAETRVVTVPPPRIEAVAATPTRVGAGDVVSLSWRTHAAAAVSLERDGLALAIDPGRAAGAVDDLPATADARHLLRAQNAVGTETRGEVHVTVGTPLVDRFTVSHDRVAPGGAVAFTWAVRGGTGLRIEDEDGHPLRGCVTVDPARIAAGGCEVRPRATSAYRLRVSNGSGTTEQAVGVLVADGPVIRELAAEAGLIDEGQDVILSWRILADLDGRAPRLSLTDETGQAYDVSTADATAGAVRLTAPRPGFHHYTLVAETPGTTPGSATASVQVRPAPRIPRLEASQREVVYGEPVTLTHETRHASEVSISPLPVAVSELPAGYVDVSRLPGAVALFPDDPSAGHAEVVFPGGFSFPWFGVAQTGGRVSVEGYLCFACSGPDVAVSHPLPHAEAPQGGVIAPFWSDLKLGPAGRLWMHHDRAADRLVLQWEGLRLSTPGGGHGALDFQIVLHGDGRFELRYGRMESPAEPRQAEGLAATIGFEDAAGARGYTFAYAEPVLGGLDGRAFRFDPRVPLSGTRQLRPRQTTTWTLEARGEAGHAAAEVTVTVLPAARLLEVGLDPAEVEVGAPFQVRWKARDATSVRVIDAAGDALCEVTGAAAREGACTLNATEVGTRQYVVEAVGRVARDVVGEVVTVDALPRLAIEAFTVEGAKVTAGQPSTLAWETTGAARVTLFEDGRPFALEGARGELSRTPDRTVEYVLEITDAAGRTRRETRTVYVDPARVDALTAHPRVLVPGESAVLTWAASHADSVLVWPADPAVVREDRPLVDLRGRGAALRLEGGGPHGPTDEGRAVLPFPDGFTFPFAGQLHDRVAAAANGYLTFASSPPAAPGSFPGPFPDPEGPGGGVVAPFFEDLEARDTSELTWHLDRDAEGRYVVVQWSGFTFWSLDGPDPRYDLTFQALLREGGAFELRYGPMTGAGDGERPAGRLAGIGWEDDGGLHGGQLAFREVVPGGLTGASWRIDPRQPPAGALTVTPTETTTYTVCATGGRHADCREVVVEVAPELARADAFTPAAPLCGPCSAVGCFDADADPDGAPTAAAPVDPEPRRPRDESDEPEDQPATS